MIKATQCTKNPQHPKAYLSQDPIEIHMGKGQQLRNTSKTKLREDNHKLKLL